MIYKPDFATFQVRNLSEWVDAKPFMKVLINELPATDEEIAGIEGLNQGLCLRICLLPMGPDSFTLQVRQRKRRGGRHKLITPFADLLRPEEPGQVGGDD